VNLKARLGGEEYDVEVRRESEGTFHLCLGEEQFAVGVSEPELGVFSLLVGDGSYEAVVRRSESGWWVALAGRCYSVETMDPSAALVGGAAAAGGSQVVRAVMAGKILEVLVSEGDEVAPGKPLLVIAAMKMENEIRSPGEGKVAGISVQAGQTVEVGAELVRIE
jgi:biotin carboxyl carrier protein